MQNKTRHELIEIFPLFLATVGFCNFMLFHRTAFQWPSADMFPFFSRMQDSTFLQSDYFTNASTVPNVRWIFGYFILGLSKLLQIDWYGSVFLTKTFLVVGMPALYYLAIYSLIKRYVSENLMPLCQALITIAILLIMNNTFNLLFSIAWWPPYSIDSTSSTASLFLGFMAIVLCESDSEFKRFSGILFFFFSVSFHPALGIFCIGFYFLSISYFIRKEYKNMIAITVVGLLLPVFLVALFFKTDDPLSAREFIEIYILNNHSFHYHLKDFGSSYPFFNWRISFALVLLLQVIPVIYLVYKKERKLLILSGVLASSYFISVLMQYIFIDVMPLKAVAVIGPVRYTQFGYWIIVLTWIVSFSPLLTNINGVQKLSSLFSALKIDNPLTRKLLLLPIPLFFFVGFTFRDDPVSEKYLANKHLYDFIRSTPKQSVFAVYKSDHTINIPLVAKRAVFTGNGFPFNENNMKEFNSRNSLIFGDYKTYSADNQLWIDQKMNNFYRKLRPADFVNVARKYKLDYVVIEADFSGNFKEFKPVFEGKTQKIYKIKDLNKYSCNRSRL